MMKACKRISAVLLAAALLSWLVPARSLCAARVRLNKTKAALPVGEKIALKVKGTGKPVKWSSSKKKIATVNSKGKVKAKKEGKAVITAKVSGRRYKCRLTVTVGDIHDTLYSSPAPDVTVSPDVTLRPHPGVSPSPLPAASAGASIPKYASVTATPSVETLSCYAGEYSLDVVHTGEGTYYDRHSTGCADLDDMEALYYTAAMNAQDYENGLAGAYIRIVDGDGDTVDAMVTDRIGAGKKGDIDMSRAAFAAIEPLATGRMDITWTIIPLPTDDPISYVFKPDSSQYWAQVQVRNGRYPISRVEYLDDATGEFVGLRRERYNYFTAPSGMGEGPFTFRVTDFYGHVLIDTDIAMNDQKTPVEGASNFPY